MHRPIKPHSHHLRNAAGIVAISLGPENRRQRQIPSRKLRFEAWIPSSVRRGSGSVPIVHLLALVTNAIRYGAAAECQLRAEQVPAVTEHAPDQMPNRSRPRILSNN